MTKAEHNTMLVKFWLERPENQRQDNSDVYIFTGWIQEHHQYLLSHMTGNPFKEMKSVLRNYIPNKR